MALTRVNIDATPLSIMSIRVWGTVATAAGFLMWLGGIARWSSPVYTVMGAIPGGPYVFGLTLMFFGILIMIGTLSSNLDKSKHVSLHKFTKLYRLRNFGLYGMGFWAVVYAIGFAVAAALNPLAPLTTWLWFLGIAAQTFILTLSQERSKK